MDYNIIKEIIETIQETRLSQVSEEWDNMTLFERAYYNSKISDLHQEILNGMGFSRWKDDFGKWYIEKLTPKEKAQANLYNSFLESFY